MRIGDILNSEAGLTLLGTLFGAAWTLFKSRRWYVEANQRRYSKALQALEAGVELTYRTYVRAVKQANADGRLTDDEMREARRLAREQAIEFGRSQGIDVLRELGEDYLDLWIAKLVKKLKRG